MNSPSTKNASFPTRSLTIQTEDGPDNVLVEMYPELAGRVEAAANAAGTSLDDFLKELLAGYRLKGQRLVDHQSVERLMGGWKK